MTTLTDFLLARIAEDEDDAQHAFSLRADCVAFDGGERPPALSVAHDYSPKRALAECEAKRRIVERAGTECSCTDHGFERAEGCAQCLACHAVTLCDGYVLADLALPYADHPDYREEWKP